MSEFHKYMDIERIEKEDCEGILEGVCHIFPKLDGTNASIWWDGEKVRAGSRTRDLCSEGMKDNFDFRDGYLAKNLDKYNALFGVYPNWHLFGEYLVQHSVKTYREEAKKIFYVFDVFDSKTNLFLLYGEYIDILDFYAIDYIPLTTIIDKPSLEQLQRIRDTNTYLIQDDKGVGEGIVIKQYGWKNKFNRYCHAKMVRNEFKEMNSRAFYKGKVENGTSRVEEDTVTKYVTLGRVDKVLGKMKSTAEWSQKRIPELLERVFHDFVSEEIWEIVKKNKCPTVNFKLLRVKTVAEIKRLKPKLF